MIHAGGELSRGVRGRCMTGTEKGIKDGKNADTAQLLGTVGADILERLSQEDDTGQNGPGAVHHRDHCADRFEGTGIGVRNNRSVYSRPAAVFDFDDLAGSLWRRRYQADGGGWNVFRSQAVHNSPHLGIFLGRTVWACLPFAEKEGAKRQIRVRPIFVPWHCWSIFF